MQAVEVTTPEGASRRLVTAWILAAVTMVGFGIGVLFTILDLRIRPAGSPSVLGDLSLILAFAMFPVIGYVLAVRRPENAIGWLLLGLGAYFGLGAANSSLGDYLIHSGARHAGAVMISFDQPSWVPIVVIPITFLLLLFPDGHLPSHRWRWFAWVVGIELTLVFLAILLDPGPMTESIIPKTRNPLGIQALRPLLDAAVILIPGIIVVVLGSLLALVLRFRRSSGIERLQLRWLLTAAGFVAIYYSLTMVASIGSTWGGGGTEPAWVTFLQN